MNCWAAETKDRSRDNCLSCFAPHPASPQREEETSHSCFSNNPYMCAYRRRCYGYQFERTVDAENVRTRSVRSLIPVAFIALATLVLPDASLLQASDNVVVVLDDSSSMRSKLRSNRRIVKMDAAKDALIQILKTLPTDTHVGVITLHDGAKWSVPLGPVDPDEMESAIRAIKPHRGTPLGKYMKIASDTLLDLRESQRYGTYRLLIVTDGEASDRKDVERYLPDILSRGIGVDVIGVDMKSDHSLATKAHSYRRANDKESLSKALSEVLAERIGSGRASAVEYEYLEGIPNDLGLAMVFSLSSVRNHPIGEPAPKPVPVGDETVVAQRSDVADALRPAEAVAGPTHEVEAQPHENDVVPESPKTSWIAGKIILLVVFGMGIVFVILVVLLLVGR